MNGFGGTWRRRMVEAMLAIYFSLAPSTVPSWRIDPVHRPVAMLMVGRPVRFLEPRPAQHERFFDTMAPGEPD